MTTSIVPVQQQQQVRIHRTGDHAWPIPQRIWPAVLFVYACLLPVELRFDIANVAIWPYRLVGLAVLPLALVRAFREPWQKSWLDAFALLIPIWTLISVYMVDGIETLLARGLALAGDFALAYLIGRTCIRTVPEFRSLLLAILPGFAITSAMIFAEALAGRYIFRPFFAKLLNMPFDIEMEKRWGLGRGMGPFPHPILAGVFTSSLLTLYWLSFRNWIVRSAGSLVALLGFFSMSATTYLALVLGFGLVGALTIQRMLRLPVFWIASAYLVLALVFVSNVSQNGLLSVISRYVLMSPTSGSYRELIWQYGLAEVERSPLVGIGVRDWERPIWMVAPSIDSFWLENAMRHGIPMVALLFAISIGGIVAVSRSSRVFRLKANRDVHIAIAMSLSIIIFCGFTVHIWEGPARWFNLLSGIAVSLAATAHSIEWRSPPTAPVDRRAPPREFATRAPRLRTGGG